MKKPNVPFGGRFVAGVAVVTAAAVGMATSADAATHARTPGPSQTAVVQALVFGDGNLAATLHTRGSMPITAQDRPLETKIVRSVLADPAWVGVWNKLSSGNPYVVEEGMRTLGNVAVRAARANAPKDVNQANGAVSGGSSAPACLVWIAVVEAVSVATTALGATQAVVVANVLMTKNWIGFGAIPATDTLARQTLDSRIAANVHPRRG